MSRRPNGNPLLKVLSFVDEYIRKHKFSPSYDEISAGTGIKAKSQVKGLLDDLCDLGFIAREGNTARSLCIEQEGYEYLRKQSGKPAPQLRIATYINQAANIAAAKLSRPVQIPILGNTFASLPTEVPTSDLRMYDAESALSISREMLPSSAKAEDMFALEVRGQSMIEAHINDGDIIIVQRSETASNGDMVVVWLDDENATTLKYFYRKENFIQLNPANSTMQPIIISGERPLRIIGKVVRVVRL